MSSIVYLCSLSPRFIHYKTQTISLFSSSRSRYKCLDVSLSSSTRHIRLCLSVFVHVDDDSISLSVSLIQINSVLHDFNFSDGLQFAYSLATVSKNCLCGSLLLQRSCEEVLHEPERRVSCSKATAWRSVHTLPYANDDLGCIYVE